MHGRQRLAGAFTIALDRIRPDPTQPRREHDNESHQQLVASIKRLGVLQPIAVRYIEAGDVYQVISGERRYQACRELQLADIPCWVQTPKDEEILLRQIVENWQRADLHPYELADSLIRLRDANGYTQKQLATETGKPESEISKLLALQKIDPEVQKSARSQEDTAFTKRHLYALTQLKPEKQREVAATVKRQKLTAIETEKVVKATKAEATGHKQRGAPVVHLRYATAHATVTLNFRKWTVLAADILAALDEARSKVATETKEKPAAKKSKKRREGPIR